MELRKVYESMPFGMPSTKQCQRIDSFVKLECYPEFKTARMINSRSDAFKCFSGPFFKALEQHVYRMPQFIKHVAVNERAQLVDRMRKSYKYYYGTDYSAFESSLNHKQMRHIECAIYRRAFGHHKQYKVLQQSLVGVNRCRTRSGVRAAIRARRMSGDMCTSVGNGLTNLMVISYLMHRLGFNDGEFECLVEGDDGLIACNVPLTAEMFAELGFIVKMVRVRDPGMASFCGLLFADTNDCIRDPCKFFEKFGWTNSCLDGGPSVMWSLLKAKCLSTLFETPNCPIVAYAAYYALKQCGAVEPRWEVDWFKDGVRRAILETGFAPVGPAPSAALRALFAELFLIPIQQQLWYEQQVMRGNFSALMSLPFHRDLMHYHNLYVC